MQETKETTKITVRAVDLGLPSGTLWGDRNLGASSPQDHGLFYSWGNVEGQRPEAGDQVWCDCPSAFTPGFSPEEYSKSEGAKVYGDIDAAHDAVTLALGKPWHMPSDDDFEELWEYCTWTRKVVNGVKGYLAKSKINGNTLFFPASGFGSGRFWFNRTGYGYFWSSTFSSARNALHMYFNSVGVNPQLTSSRFLGFSVRPVQ